MNDKWSTLPDEPAQASIDRAVQAILSESVPEASLSQVLTRASRWDAQRIRRRHYRAAAVCAAAVVAAASALISLYWQLAPTRHESDKPVQNVGQVAARAGFGPGTSQSGDVGGWFYKAHPMTHAVVSPSAPVFITSGPEDPATLGSKVRREELFKGVAEGSRRLHVWDWSESDRSRVVTVPRAYGCTALSPDGKTLLYSSGVAIHLSTARAQPVGGFETQAGERIWKLRYSPTGRLVLAWIVTESEPKNMRLRVVDMTTGSIAHELSAGRYARFLPDEASLVYSRPHPEIPRRAIVACFDLKNGETNIKYEPELGPKEQNLARNTYGTFEAVGIAVSGDGGLVAVGYYYGQLSILETRTGRQISRTLFQRADGSRDTFFQAKLMRFSPDGALLAAASGSRLKIVETRSGKALAGHYHEATPTFVHLEWDGLVRVVLLADSSIGDMTPDPSVLSPTVTADILPRLYEWKWKAGEPVVKKFPRRDR